MRREMYKPQANELCCITKTNDPCIESHTAHQCRSCAITTAKRESKTAENTKIEHS